MDRLKPKEEQIKAVDLGLTDNPERRAVDLGKPKEKQVFNAPKIICACGKPVGPESPQIDQCLACFNRA